MMINRYLVYIGLRKEKPHEVELSEEEKQEIENEKIYSYADEQMAPVYLEYVEKVNKNQEARLQTIESKSFQLIGQSSIVISVAGLFIPLFVDKLKNISIIYNGILVLVFLLVISHFVLSIYYAARMMLVNKYWFMSGATRTVTKSKRLTTKNAFVNEEIKDLVASIRHNNDLTDTIAINLALAGRCFMIGITGLFSFIILTVGGLVFVKETTPKVEIVKMPPLVKQKCDSITVILKHEPAKAEIAKKDSGRLKPNFAK